jgi:hypothetical protein
MTLTRKHFETIAAELRAAQPTNPGSKLGYHLAITAVATGLQQINAKFDRRRFIAACTCECDPLRHRMQLDAEPLDTSVQIALPEVFNNPDAREALAQAGAA